MIEIKVHIVTQSGRGNLFMRYRCPVTGKQVKRSTGTSRRTEAIKIAAKWEAELQEGRYNPGSKMQWADFRCEYEGHAMGGLKFKSVQAYTSTLNALEHYCRPRRIGSVTTDLVDDFVTKLRTAGRSEATVARHLRHLKAICRWAAQRGYLSKLPVFKMPKAAKGSKKAKGRALSEAEFQAMLDAVPIVMENAAAPSWQFFLKVLWASGLRVGEAINLRWDPAPGCPVVHLDGRHSVLAFDADSQKSGEDQLCPLAPEAVEVLAPHQKQSGYVFNLLKADGTPMLRRANLASKYVARIGEKSGIVVNRLTGKFASAHDLRRSFGKRWSRRVMPTQLKELMRHANINTTMDYYVDENAREASAELWDARGTHLGTRDASRDSSESENPLNHRE